MTANFLQDASLHERIRAVVQQIPSGRVATYGQIAAIVGGCSAQMIGFAMAGLPRRSTVPWQRVINRQGKVSPRGTDKSGGRQRALLEYEGVTFNAEGEVRFSSFGWTGPPAAWIDANEFTPAAPPWLRDVDPK